MEKERNDIPVADKYLLTIREAAEYTNIGINKIETLLNEPLCPFELRHFLC